MSPWPECLGCGPEKNCAACAEKLAQSLEAKKKKPKPIAEDRRKERLPENAYQPEVDGPEAGGLL